MAFVVGTKSHLLWCEHSLNRERRLVMNVWLNSEENTFTDVFDITSDIGDFRPLIFCPRATKELPRNYHEAGPPIQLPTDALSQIDYGHTRHYEDCKEVCLCQRTTFKKSILENLSRSMRMAEWKMSPPRFKTYRLLWLFQFLLFCSSIKDVYSLQIGSAIFSYKYWYPWISISRTPL